MGGVTMFKVNKVEKINKSKANVPMTVRFPEDIYNEYKKLSENSGQSFQSIIKYNTLLSLIKCKLIYIYYNLSKHSIF